MMNQCEASIGFCRQCACLCSIIVVMMMLPAAPASAESGAHFQPPPNWLSRADEDYRYLADQARRTDLWDPLKYVPLNESIYGHFFPAAS
jgi:hypothetical protein